jgi:hypothetical protein
VSRTIWVHWEERPTSEPDDLGSPGEDLASQPEGFRPISPSAALQDLRADVETDDLRNYPERLRARSG